ncbi:amino acid adenylation domain-containing protein [Leptolyngbyaceae cyanobacterium UHCC 1019]
MTNRAIAEFISHLKSLDVQLFVEGEQSASLDKMRLRCNAPEGTLTPELRQELADRKAELIAYLHHSRLQSIPLTSTIQPITQSTTQEKVFPLSFAQQRLWFLYQLTPDNPFYNVPAAIRLTGMLDQTALARSFNEIGRRHAALRTTFTIANGQPIQVIAPHLAITLPVVNLQSVAVQERERIAQQLATTEAQRPFNLTADPLLRVTLLQFAPTESILLLTLHHIVADGWSLGVLIQELVCFYTAFVEQRSPNLPPLPIQYTDFANWQRHWLQGAVLEKQLAYWRKQLQDLPGLDLPSDRPRPAVQTYRGATYPVQFSPTLTQSLADLSQQSGASLFMTLLAAFQTLLYRYTGQDDIAIGSPIANRHRSELEGLIGFFVNSVVMRSDLSGNPTFRELLKQVQNVALEAYAHQDLPFEKLVEELDPERDLSRNPLFQVALALQNAPMQPLELPGLTLEPAPLESGSTRFDLEVHLWEPTHGLRSLWQSQTGLSGFISYSTEMFDRDRIGHLIEHFQTLLQGIVDNPDARLSDLPLLTSAEHQQIVVEWNQTCTDDTRDRCFHHLFEAHARQTPEAIAVVSESRSLTYRELNQQADDLAQTLRQMGVQPDALVGLCVDRSIDLVIGILGILKAGGVYVPLDPNYPSDRLLFMLTDTQVSILLTQSWLVESLPISSAKILCLDQPLPLIEPDQETSLTPDHLAYVIYTSGSTGNPKGVLLTHRGLCNVVEAQRIFHPCRESRILQFSSLSFDASIFEIALAFGCGGTLYIPPKAAQLPGIALVQFLHDHAITHALLTPAVLAVLPFAELPTLQVLITGGEACSSQVVDRWAANRRFFNAYGPTETTIWATVAELHPGDHPLTIGRPILNTQVYILDAALNSVPTGIPGELYISGKGLAQGYLNRPELTAKQFIDDPFNSKPKTENSKLYKTGDRAQYRSDGAIEFLGRVDQQIKIRGFRVELGEIEATLQAHPAIQEAVVIAAGESSNEMRLTAYFSLDSIQRTACANHQHFQHTILQSLQTQQIQYWQTLYNQTYESLDRTQNSTLKTQNVNITGWNSSYTGEPIPLEQMQEWVRDRVQQVLALKPKRVLEIGCGTGLLLFQIAPHCQKYVGTDFSTISLEAIQHQLEDRNLPQVELLPLMANDFEGIDNTSFDVVILNSIVQYFPSVDYLMQVLESAIQTVAIDGVLMIGDVRSLPLLNAFHAWMKFSQADANIERTQLQYQVERSRFEEPELAIAPAFFHALCDKFSQIQQVQIRLSRGHSPNEMTQFRYNVLLHLRKIPSAAPSTLRSSIQPHNWKLNPITVEEIQRHLIENQPEILIITNVVNSRVNAAVKIANWLSSRAAPKTVGRMRDLLQSSTEQAIAPQDWWDLEAVLPYTIEITWSTQTHTGDYDVQLTRQGIDIDINARLDLPTSEHQFDNHYTNDPLQSQFAHQLIPALRQHLRKTLPDYMVPSAFVPLAAFPLTANGKIDRVSIAEQNRHISVNEGILYSSNAAIAPSVNRSHPASTSTELTLIDIWQELLRLQHINTHDNFFELGGHSLLATQMISRVSDVFGLELPLKSVFEAPTIAQLAPLLETLRDTTSKSKIPPFVRLDRAAHRRSRLILDNSNSQILPEISVAKPPQPDAHTINAWSPLVPLVIGDKLDGSKQPFFCVHPMFGVVFPYLELAHHLGSDRSFYGLQPLGLDGKSPPLNRIEAIAAYYIQAIQTVQPQGPYLIGGWSFGGMVAFEMAQQLTQAGEQIALLAILDTPAPVSNNQLSLYQSLKFLLGTVLWSTLPFLLDYGAISTHRLQFWNSWLSRWQWSTIASLVPDEARLRLLDESAIAPMLRIVYAHIQATYRYKPQSYPNRITLFKAAEQPDSIQHDLTLGWDALAQAVQLHQVPGNHLSLLKQPHVQTLAQQLRRCLS